MEFYNLTKEYNEIKDEINQAIQNVLNSGQFIGGKEVEYLEKEIANYCGVKYAISVNSGTDALLLSLEAIDIKGKEVITTPFTFIATVGAIIRAGGIPVFVDINEDNFNIDVSKIKKVITQNTKAILPVHLFGNICQMKKIIRLAKDYGLVVIEDAAQAFGSDYDKKKIGSFGHLTCFSFYPTKNLGGYGDGGMIVTNNKEFAYKIKLLKNHGSLPQSKYNSIIIGTNSRLDAIQASILRVKLKYVDKQIETRRKNAKYYSEKLNQPYFKNSSYNQYTIRIKNRNKVKLNFPYQIYYPKPLHLLKALEYLGYEKGNFPIAEKVAKEVISLPLLVSKEEQDYVIKQLKNYI